MSYTFPATDDDKVVVFDLTASNSKLSDPPVVVLLGHGVVGVVDVVVVDGLVEVVVLVVVVSTT